MKDTLLKVNNRQLSIDISKEVFKGSPKRLSSQQFWNLYYQFLGKNGTDFSIYLDNKLAETEDIEGLIGKYCTMLLQAKSEQQAQREQVKEQSDASKEYIKVIKGQGYKVCDDSTSIAYKKGQKTNLLSCVKAFCTNSKNVIDINRQVLTDKGFNGDSIDIWSNSINKLHEDLTFRLFLKETDISYDIVLKLPLGLEQFDFDKNQSTLDKLLGIFSSTNPKDSYKTSLSGSIGIKKISYMFGIDSCPYDALMFVLSKDLLHFKNSNYLVTDYLEANNGVANNFQGFESDLCLGNKIVVGVTPGKLTSVTLHPSDGTQLNGMLMSGAAGSGKSAFLDSLLVQGLALDNKDYGRSKANTKLNAQGNGAVVLLDAKSNEWVKPWQRLLQGQGLIAYGFDGNLVDNSLLKYTKTVRGEDSTLNIDANIPEYILGMCFLSSLRKVIRAKYGLIGAKDSVVYNTQSEVDKLPRILILADEVNTMSEQISPKTYGNLFKKFLMAKDTRTVNYHWVLAGQNLKAQVISNQEKSNYPYKVLGSLDASEYEYHGVTEDKSVVDYERKTAKGTIMSQGMFYYGYRGGTELIKSMYLPDDDSTRTEALNLVKARNSLAGMQELHELVRWGLQYDLQLFKDDMLTEKYPNNNAVLVALYINKAITEDELEYYTEVLRGGGTVGGGTDTPNEELEAFRLDQDQSNNQENSQALNNINLKGLDIQDIQGASLEAELVGKEQVIQQDTKQHTNTYKPNQAIVNSPMALKVFADKSFEDILKGHPFKSNRDVVHLQIFNNEIWFNGEYVSTDLDEQLTNIASIKVISRAYKQLKGLDTDSITMTKFLDEVADDLGAIFKQLKQLEYICVHKQDGSLLNITREIVLARNNDTSQATETIAQEKTEGKVRNKLKMGCQTSPKKKWQFSRITDKIYGMNLVSDSFQRAKKNIWYSNKDGLHPVRALGWSMLGLGTLAVTGVGSGIIRGIEGTVNLVRNSLTD